MKMPASVLETSFNELVPTSTPVVPMAKNSASSTGIIIKPEYIVLGAVTALVIIWVVYKLKKSREEEKLRYNRN